MQVRKPTGSMAKHMQKAARVRFGGPRPALLGAAPRGQAAEFEHAC